jgi:hypothetical protein
MKRISVSRASSYSTRNTQSWPSAAADCGAFRVVSAVAVRAAMRSRRRVTASFGWSKLMKDKAMMKCGYSSWGGCATSVRNQL